MNEYGKYYTESLFPFQDGILAIARSIKAPFYLTGGTALSRHYCPVRYSDDLDLFVNRHSEFAQWVDKFYAKLEKESAKGLFSIVYDRVQRFGDYAQLFLKRIDPKYEDLILKVDLVNDVAPHYGTLEWNDKLGQVDSWRNILSNKVAALYRIEPKDVVDLWCLAKLKHFNWAEIVSEASAKEAGLDHLVLYDLLKSFPQKELSAIKWIAPYNGEGLMFDLAIMAEELFEARDNSLHLDNLNRGRL